MPLSAPTEISPGAASRRKTAWYFGAACGKHCTGYGVKTNPGALCFWTVDGEGATLWLDVRNGADGVILNGRELLAAVLVQDESDSMSAFHFQQRFCRKLCDHPLLPQRPVYGGNNWCYAYGDSSAEQILKDSTLMKLCAEGLENRPFMVIDDCWQELARLSGSGAQGRPYERGNAMFPDMPGLADEMKQMGVRPGIWIRPLRTAEKYIDSNLIVPRPEDRWHIFLDPSLDAVHELISEDIARIRGWGYELIKYDFVQHDIMGDFGSDTQAAVMKFQQDNGLEATGVYDAATHEKLVPSPDGASVSEAEPDTIVPEGPAVEIVTKNGSTVNVRVGNGTEYKVIKEVKTGEVLSCIATAGNGWNAVKVGTQVGWVSGEYSRINE